LLERIQTVQPKSEPSFHTSSDQEKYLGYFARTTAYEHTQRDQTFPEFAARFLFERNGTMTYSDNDHQLRISVLGEENERESELTIASLPVCISLSKKRGYGWSTVDQFSATLTPHTYQGLRKAQGVLSSGAGGFAVWEAYMKLK